MSNAKPHKQPLSTQDHSRDSAGMTYVYPVISRRAGGVSIGINLNPNNACNWHCIYCQVPNLQRGTAPSIDLSQLEQELAALSDDLLHGDFMQRRVPEDARRIKDIAFSGNGEPTSAKEFVDAIGIVIRLRQRMLPDVKLRLITNGSLIEREHVQQGLRLLAQAGGEVWFKLDVASRAGMARINDVSLEPDAVLRRLRLCAELCPTWIQTCCFTLDGQATLNATEQQAWLALVAQARQDRPGLMGVHLYGLARPSMQAGAQHLGKVSQAWLEDFAKRIKQQGLTVSVSP